MQPEAILEHPAVRLTEDERRHYFERGYVAVAGASGRPSGPPPTGSRAQPVALSPG